MKTKFSHAYTQEYPYRINNVLECEFYLLEMMVSIDVFFFIIIIGICNQISNLYLL